MIRKKPGELAFNIGNIFFMTVLMILMLYPFWYVLAVSLNDSRLESWVQVMLWPKGLTLVAYRTLFTTSLFINGYVITILRTLIGTVLSVLLNGMAAYVLSRKDLLGRKVLLWLLLLTLYFSGGIIPVYLLIRNLGLLDQFAVLIIPALMSSWYIILMKSFFSQLSSEMLESAKIDGANDLHIFFKFVIPVSMPIIAVITLFTAIGLWNDWFTAEMFITNNQNLLPIQTILRRVIFQLAAMDLIRKNGGASWNMLANSDLESVKMAGILVTVIPIACIYPFLQRYFIKGVMLGSLKG